MPVKSTGKRIRQFTVGGAQMAEYEMNEAERKALSAANRIFGHMSPARRRRRNQYLFWETPDQRRYAYTPWSDRNGNYFTMVYKPVGKGSQSGKAKKWKLMETVRARTRKLAMKRAFKRYNRRMEIYHGQTQNNSER